MISATYGHQAQADLPGVAFSAMRQILVAQAKASSLKVLEDAPDRITLETAHGLIGLRPGTCSETAGMVAAVDGYWLFVMKSAVASQMAHLMPEVAKAMRWSDASAETSLPANFTFAQAVDVQELGDVFLRVTLQGDDFSRHGDESIHFRLVQQPPDAEVEWPRVAPNGSVAWAEGPGAPHRPVYTTRFMDAASNTLVTDVFLHEGGRTTEWAQSMLAGERKGRVVGVLGPSGGGLLRAANVLMASDETGFPAAARLLENLPDGARGALFLEAENGAQCQYPIDIPNGIDVVWLTRANGNVLADAVLEALPDHRDAHIWFAGERQQATRIREAAKSSGWDKDKLRISGFWRSSLDDG
ncbi:MAG: siderophore-interacting protein [Pseudomonadota bacterium]